jgi:hypothetical protein
LGRVLFTAKAAANAGPTINWSEIESRLQEIAAGPRPSDLPPDLPIEPSVTLANDPPAATDWPVTRDQPVINPGDPLEMLSLLTANLSKRS